VRVSIAPFVSQDRFPVRLAHPWTNWRQHCRLLHKASKTATKRGPRKRDHAEQEKHSARHREQFCAHDTPEKYNLVADGLFHRSSVAKRWPAVTIVLILDCGAATSVSIRKRERCCWSGKLNSDMARCRRSAMYRLAPYVFFKDGCVVPGPNVLSLGD
jgi:hypothetical protein